MIVTKVERQKRDPHRVNISIDGEFAFGIRDDVLAEFGLRKGDPITQEIVDALQSSEEFSRAKQKALQLFSYRMRSERELEAKLREKEFPPAIIKRVIEQLSALGIVNDKEFARAFVHDAQLRKPAGRRLLHNRLRVKGISTAIIEEVLEENSDPDGEYERALQAATTVLKRYKSSLKVLDQKKQEQRLAQFLARRGFDWSIISPVLRQLFRTPPEEAKDVISHI
jgi:regulatory protein